MYVCAGAYNLFDIFVGDILHKHNILLREVFNLFYSAVAFDVFARMSQIFGAERRSDTRVKCLHIRQHHFIMESAIR